MNNFSIYFVGLSLGKHDFYFEINDKFFADFEYSQIQESKIEAHVALEKKERMMVLNVAFKGFVRATCDRCLDEFNFPVSGNEKLIVKLGERFEEESDDVVIIPETVSKFDISSYLYEYIHLALPARIVHAEERNGDSACNPEMLHKIKNMSDEEKTDPRWDILKNLKEK